MELLTVHGEIRSIMSSGPAASLTSLSFLTTDGDLLDLYAQGTLAGTIATSVEVGFKTTVILDGHRITKIKI